MSEDERRALKRRAARNRARAPRLTTRLLEPHARPHVQRVRIAAPPSRSVADHPCAAR